MSSHNILPSEESEEEERIVSYGKFRGLSPMTSSASLPVTSSYGSPGSLSAGPPGERPSFMTKIPVPAGRKSARNEDSEDEGEIIPQRDPVENALQNCFDQVIRPVAYFLCFLGWRPFPYISSRHHIWGYRILDVFYPSLVFAFLAFSYAFGLFYAVKVDRAALISENILGAVVSSFIWIYGMWYFRRDEGQAFEELSALIETVYLYSSNTHKLSQDRLTQTLTNYLITAAYMLLFYMGYALWVGITLATQLASNSPVTSLQFLLAVVVISIGYVAEIAVYVAAIVIYWIICRLHMQYLDGIRERLMTRICSLSRATRDVASAKKLIGDLNHGWAVAISFLTFALSVDAVFVQIRFFEGEQFQFELVQAALSFTISVGLFFASVFPASMVCWKGERLKGMSWKLRSEQHYRNSTPEQLDSFLLFCSNAKMHAKIMGLPIFKEFLYVIAGLILVTVFFLWRIGLYSPHF